MNILFISDVFFPRVNGVSTSINTFATELRALGHQVTLIAPSYTDEDKQEEWIVRVPSHKIYFDPEDRLMNFGKLKALLPWIRDKHFDVIHIHTPFTAHYVGIHFGKKLDIPVVETYHTFFEDYLHHYLPFIPQFISRKLARTISRRQCNAVDGIVSPSKPMLDVLKQYGIKTPAEVVATGLDDSSFAHVDGEHFRMSHDIPLAQPMLLFVGRVAHEKNIGFLLEMHVELIKKHPDALLVITGEGPAEESIKHSIDKLDISNKVRMIGYLDRSHELIACYKAADIFVFASKSETQGLVLLEAMAQGTAVVAIAELGTKSILIEGEGVLIAKDDINDFADKVSVLLSDAPKRQMIGEKGRQYAQEKWGAGVLAKKVAKFYKSTINQKSSLSRYMDTRISNAKEST
ncbi:glycosyltransferase family 4 protein [Candidatus Methylopumilus universalis]|uniref:Glycosyltransferase family 4 protein n=1 Tax=Candidatus Methylopumilus universalis TaxID=2588536 RepID=A0AAX1EZU8_9PROT|nr:glycosyltransferase [Candidatus Methylopumilus universalis]QDC41334.1 glycosyltransferase family 4 protein [Candidatus Methylopumilus universalis]QDC42617.1 glycosyltransferase family 4 protein [Candidatus Methylopumilus universalis]QDC55003.1 glycosyltransferase family 4 protein [Candidatus Methylopumilus universalis]QDC56284.1 glycosyltransferase family 4 protein [Candidatus Methylopumilus universalis]QDC57573.1 glycosyltransferase family 4 protein [Candidatus Methylopumilus universalis]